MDDPSVIYTPEEEELAVEMPGYRPSPRHLQPFAKGAVLS